MMKQEIRNHLEQKILPFWENLKDTENGGFYGYMDENLVTDRTAYKGCILNSRILWTFSTAAQVLGKEELRPYADHAYAFLKKYLDPEYGGVYWSVTCDGEPLDTTKHTYCQAFAVYGLAAYYQLTGNREALQIARNLVRLLRKVFRDEGGYLEALQADFSPESNEKLSENGVMASRTMNTLMHVLECLAELYRVDPEETVREMGVEALDRFLHTFWNPEKRRLEVFCDNEYRPLLDMQSYGHDIEGSWLIWDAVETFLPEGEREPYRAMCLELVKSPTERAFTKHGLKYEIVNGEENEIRAWWPQAETMLGFEFAWRMTGDRAWLEKMKEQWNYIRTETVDPREGSEWWNELHEDGTSVGKAIVDEWKCPYHNGRMCLRLIRADLPADL